MDTTNASSDLAEFFDFGEAAMPDVMHHHTENVVAVTERHSSVCPSHGTDSADGCICHGFMGDFEIPETATQTQNKDEWNSDFSSWIPRYSKPEHACEYCRSRQLECFITYEGQKTCSPCSALFRPCSFNRTAEPSRQSRHVLDTLDIVNEDNAHCFGGLTGKTRAMRSLGHKGPIDLEQDEDAENKNMKKGGIRFPRQAIKVLKEWMEEHIDHPYPTEEDKMALKEKTGLTSSQISNWMANTRRRQKARPKRTASPSIRPTEAIDIPAGRTWESLNPFERWKHSPPENEPAPMTAIAKAVEDFDLPEPPSLSSSLGNRRGESNGSSGSFSVFRAPSTTSLETGATNFSSGSVNSLRSAWSYGSRNSRNSFNTFDSFGSNPTKERRRRRRVPARTSKTDSDPAKSRVFQCTFCTDTFKSKYDWSRHEKSLHLSLEKWICAPLGDVITCTSSGRQKCTYCDTLDPTSDHLESHNHKSCEEKGLESRTFYRKDHLRQHLRLIHNCKMTPSMETWKSEATFIRCRCGFCGAEFTRWQDRVDHLAKEFRNGAKMKDWKGCRGLDPNVAALVTNAMPPYLIGNESKSPFPFSASNTASMAHHLHPLDHMVDLETSIPSKHATAMSSPLSQEFMQGPLQTAGLDFNSDVFMREACALTGFPTLTSPTWASQTNSNSNNSPNSNAIATCWEILTLRLGRFVRQKIEQEGPGSCTDDVLQAEARRILYDDDDSWNQTAADNPEWLALFKKAHGIVDVPANFDRNDALEDLGVMGDITAFDSLVRAPRWGVAIPELECDGKGEPCFGENGEVGVNLGLGTVQECFRFPGWGPLADGECEEVPGLTENLKIVDADMGELPMFNWDEGIDGAVFNMGCGA